MNVREFQVALELTLEDDVTHVMDRRYEKCKHFEQWMTDGIKFVDLLFKSTSRTT